MLSNRYISDRFLPDKAIDLVDEVAAGPCSPRSIPCPPSSTSAMRRIMQLEIEREALKKEKDTASRERLGKIEKELADLPRRGRRAPSPLADRKEGRRPPAQPARPLKGFLLAYAAAIVLHLGVMFWYYRTSDTQEFYLDDTFDLDQRTSSNEWREATREASNIFTLVLYVLGNLWVFSCGTCARRPRPPSTT